MEEQEAMSWNSSEYISASHSEMTERVKNERVEREDNKNDDDGGQGR